MGTLYSSCIFFRLLQNRTRLVKNALVSIFFFFKKTTTECSVHHLLSFIFSNKWGFKKKESIIPGYIRECSAAIIVYDVTSKKIHIIFFSSNIYSERSTFESVCRWVEEVRAERGNDATIAVVGNKIDSEDKKYN